MADVEKQFNEIVEHDLADVNSVETIAKMMAELHDQMNSLKPIIDEAKAQKEVYTNEINLKKKEINELAEASHAIDVAVFDTQKKLREIEREMNAQDMRLKQAIENKHMAEEYARLSDEFDRMITGLPWLEAAFPHQINGAKKLAVVGSGILADKRGLGKSLTSMIWLDMIEAKKVIVIVPNDTVGNYVRELEHWAPHRTPVKMAQLNKNERDFMIMTLKMLEEFVIVINYEAWRRDKGLLDQLSALQLDAMIIDEAHHIKNTQTAAFKGIKQLVTAENCCSNCGSAKVVRDMGYAN